MSCQFEFVQGSGAPYEDIKQLLATKAIGEEAIQPMLDALIGWSLAICREVHRSRNYLLSRKTIFTLVYVPMLENLIEQRRNSSLLSVR